MPRIKKVRDAAARAVRDPATWLPAAGAVIMSATGLDKRVSQWAAKENPVFGSKEAALRASDRFRDATQIGFVSTALLAPSGQYLGEVTTNKLKGVGMEMLAVEGTSAATSLLKDATGRERPNDAGATSFPSAHTSSAFSYAALGQRNLEGLNLSPGTKRILDYGFTALALGTAWARVEGEAHYPSDVLAGAALGNFVSGFFYDAFLNAKDEDEGVDVSVKPQGKGAAIEVHVPF